MTLSRRELIGGGAALVGTGAIVALGDRSAAALEPTEPSPSDLETLDGPVMLSVSDAAAGEVEILVGEHAVTFTDRRLVARLARETRRGAF